MARAGKAVRFMHDAGLYHTDLNLRNLLVDRDRRHVFVIDFDRAQVFDEPVPPALRRRNVARLLRSIRKLDPARQYVSEEDWQSFLAAYHD
jgi:3-deoxy-D-manno-octulosonic acid kinase